MKKKRIAFVPADDRNWELYGKKLLNSLRKFHSEEQLPLVRIDKPADDPMWFYRAKPIIAKELLEQYEIVIGMDADQIVTGDLSDLWRESEGNFDVGTVLNDPTYPIQIWDIQPYFNNGLVVMKSKEFVDHWLRLCYTPHFDRAQFREQDMLNILCSDYFNYRVKCFDYSDKIYGEFAKPSWIHAELKDNKIMINNRQLNIIHFGGGAGSPDKGNYRLRFQTSVVKYIDSLVK